MKLVLLTIAWCLLEVTKGENCDGSHMSLHDMELRLSNNTYTCQGSGENCITDANLASGWYDVGSRNMPTDPSGLRTYSSCGTHWPIWLNGTVPKTSEGRQQRKACLKSPSSICDPNYPFDEIEVINCGTHMLYKLSPAPFSWIAFCFDPVELVPDSATVKPGLLFRNKEGVTGKVFKKPELYLRCQFNGIETDELYYSVSWPLSYKCHNQVERNSLVYTTLGLIHRVRAVNVFIVFIPKPALLYVNDIFLLRKGPVQLSNINDTNLYESELINGGYRLDINIKCIINSSKSSDIDSGNSTTSGIFWLGIRVLNPSVSMIQGRTTTIQLQSTFPFGCSSTADDQNPQPKCLLSVNMFDPNDRNDCKHSSISVTGSQKCGVQIPGFYYHQWMPGVPYDNVTKMSITTRNTNDYDQGRNRFVLSLRTGGSGLNDIVQGSYINNIIVTTSSERSWQGKTCYSYIDPHMRSFDGRYYENQNPGVFVLYRHKSSKQEVQMRTKRCNSIAFCACAMAVRAGGDLFIIDLCSSLGLIKHVSCKENILDVRQVNAYMYKIYMPLGTMVSVTINNWGLYESWLNLNIYPSVKDVQETRGLCGVLNDNQSDDFMNPSGSIETDNNVFSLSWSLGQTDSFFDPQNHSPELWDEDSLFCVCPAALNTATLPSTSSGSEFDPLCSASISLTCSTKVQVPGNQYQTCNIRTKRSKHSLSKEIERILKREVMDNDRISHNIEKRSIINITLDEALAECTHFFAANCATALFKDNLPNSNLNSMNSSITNCALDYVYTGDMSLASLHCETYRAEVEEEIARNSTFREANPDVVELFRAMACINNCSNHGDCVNGSCICEGNYTEEDCSVSLSNYPVVKDTYAGGLCQTDEDDCCGDVPIYGTRFVKGVTKQKLEIINIYLNGTKVVEDPIIELIPILNPFEAQININCHRRRQRSTDSENSSTIFVMGTRVSLTNDGTNYGPAKSYYILDSKCQGILNDTDGYTFYLQDGTCFISGTCYNEREQDSVDRCKRCQPTINRFSWTDECTSSNDPQVAKDNTPVIIAVCIGTFVILLVIVTINIIKCCLKKEKRIAGHIEINVPVSTVGPSTFDKTSLFRSQQSLQRDDVFRTNWKNVSSNNTTLNNRPETPGLLSFQKVLLEMELPEK